MMTQRNEESAKRNSDPWERWGLGRGGVGGSGGWEWLRDFIGDRPSCWIFLRHLA